MAATRRKRSGAKPVANPPTKPAKKPGKRAKTGLLSSLAQYVKKTASGLVTRKKKRKRPAKRKAPAKKKA